MAAPTAKRGSARAGDGVADDQRSRRGKRDKTQTNSRPVVQRIPRGETKRRRPSGHGKADARAFQTSAATFSPLHVSTDDKGGLQIGVPEGSHPSMLLFALCMTFGGARNPSHWSDVSEVIADLANGLVRRSNCLQAGGPADERGGRQ